MSSPLDSPDVLNTLVPLSDIGMTSASMGSMKLPSLDSINLKQQKQQQVRLFRSKRLDSGDSYENLQRLASALVPTPHNHGSHPHVSQGSFSHAHTGNTLDHGLGLGLGHDHGHVSVSATGTINHTAITASTQTPQSQLCSASLPSRTTSPARQAVVRSCGGGSMPNGVGDSSLRRYHTNSSGLSSSVSQSAQSLPSASASASSKCLTAIPEVSSEPLATAATAATATATPAAVPSVPRQHAQQKLLEFSLSSVGRSFIDESSHVTQQVSLTTPETPTPNISPSSQVCNSDAFSNDFVPASATATATATVAAQSASAARAANIPLAEFGGSWDLLELDLQLNEVNLDPCYDTDVEECIFLGDGVGAGSGNGGIGQTDADDDSDDDSVVVDDPFGMLPTKPTPPDSLDL